ncbi:MAG: putative enzyme of heme biosynthesis (HemY-like) protein [Rhodospirillaceae bacterium]|nr:MAG: putative enzyme of heme biosynthesis (HemY-like) protein [Rhodospirillaceae bacterium]
MVRILVYVIAVVGGIGIAVWLADHPGTVTLEWQGWRLDTTVPVLLLLLVLLTGVLAVLWRLLGLLWALPHRMHQRHGERRRRRGYAALSAGFAAIAAGDAGRATKMANEAGRRLGDPETSLLLQAQAAELSGDGTAVRKYYGLLRANPVTEMIGLKGLITEAHRTGQHDQVLDLARRAVTVQPVDWAVRALFKALVREHRWADAGAALAHNHRTHAFKPHEAERYQIVLDTQQALEADAAGDRRTALRLTRRVLRKEAGMVPASLLAARLYHVEGKTRKAAGVVEDAWRRTPHPGLAQAYFDIWPGDDALKRTQRAERLAVRNPDHPEGRLMVAGAALEAHLWGQARSQLAPLLAAEVPPQRAVALMARLEQLEHDDATTTANVWLQRVSMASPDAGWRCRNCGTDTAQWGACCAHCDGFDALAWVAAPSRALSRRTERTRAVT